MSVLELQTKILYLEDKIKALTLHNIQLQKYIAYLQQELNDESSDEPDNDNGNEYMDKAELTRLIHNMERKVAYHKQRPQNYAQYQQFVQELEELRSMRDNSV